MAVDRHGKWGSWGGWFYNPGTFSYPTFQAKEWNASQFLYSMRMGSSTYTQRFRAGKEQAWIDWNAGDDHAVLSTLIGLLADTNDYIVTIMHAASSNRFDIMEMTLEPADVFHAWLLYANYGPGGP